MPGGAALVLALLLPQAVPQSGGVVIFAPERAAELLKQCSRATPRPGEGGWMPTAADIARLETRLPAAIYLMRPNPYTWKVTQGAPTGWGRQYVGVVRGGKRYIYGNFVPNDIVRDARYPWRDRPISMCDGGPGFFGAEYDLEMDAISHLAFN